MLTAAARVGFEAWGDSIDLNALAEPFLAAATVLHHSVVKVVNREFRSEIADLIARQLELKATFPNYFAS